MVRVSVKAAFDKILNKIAFGLAETQTIFDYLASTQIILV